MKSSTKPHFSFLKQALSLFMMALVSMSMLACSSNGSKNKDNEAPELTAFFLYLGLSLEGVELGPPPPYKYKSDNKAQRYAAASEEKTTIFNNQGKVIDEIDRFSPAYGALYLAHSTAGDFVVTWGPDGRELCPLGDGFCQIDPPGSTNTTSAKYAKNNNGETLFNSFYRVRNGSLRKSVEIEGGFEESEVYDGSDMPDAEAMLFAYSPISMNTGIGVTDNGYAFFIDTGTDSASRIDDGIVGDGVRDVECKKLSGGDFACVIQSYIDKTLTLCMGTNVSDFTCGVTTDAGDGVSIGVAETDSGNIGVVSTGYTDSKVYLTEFTPEFGVGPQVEFFPTQYLSLFANTGITMDYLGHAEVDPQGKGGLVTDYELGVVAGFLMNDLESEQESLLGVTDFTVWFK